VMKLAASIVGGILLLGGVAVAFYHYLVESSDTSKFITLAIAAALLVVGWALFDYGTGATRRWRGGKPNGDGPK